VTKVADSQNGAEPARSSESGEQILIASTPLDGCSLPSRVLIAPWGEVRSANGTFVIDEEAGRAVLEAFKAHGTELPIDYEHQSLGGVYASPNGQAPAAGWIRKLDVVLPGQAGDGDAGLFAEVAWTAAAREKLAAREYRYLSPVVIVRTRDRRVVALHSAALTNKPAIVGMKPIVNRQGTPGVQEPVAEMGREEALALLRMRVDVPEQAGAEEVLVAAAERIDALRDELARHRAAEKVAAAMRAGKLSGAQRSWAMELAMKDPAGFDAWAASAPPVVMQGRTRAPGEGATGGCDRTAVIAKARAVYRAEPALQLLTSERAWVADALRERNLTCLSDEEAVGCGIAVT